MIAVFSIIVFFVGCTVFIGLLISRAPVAREDDIKGFVVEQRRSKNG